jgi:hypothetical protein
VTIRMLVCLGGHISKCSNEVAKTSWDAAQGMFDNLPGMLVG